MSRPRGHRRSVAVVTACLCGLLCLGVAVAVAAAGTTRSNERAAIRDATRLIAAVRPPSGAVLVSRASGTGVRGDHLLFSAFASAWASASWRVQGSTTPILASVAAHLPTGFHAVGSGSSSGPGESSRSLSFAEAAVPGELVSRELIVGVSRDAGGEQLWARAQSQWVVERSARERVPASTGQIEITDGLPGRRPAVSRRVTAAGQVAAIVRLINSLAIVQPAAINCGAAVGSQSEVTVQFETRSGRSLGEVQSDADAPGLAPDSPAWACSPVALTLAGHAQPDLAGNVVGPLERLLGIRLPVLRSSLPEAAGGA